MPLKQKLEIEEKVRIHSGSCRIRRMQKSLQGGERSRKRTTPDRIRESAENNRFASGHRRPLAFSIKEMKL